jgi:hypothetical protein
MKFRPVGAEIFHTDGRTDGQTDMTKLIVAFRSLAKGPKNHSVKAVSLRSIGSPSNRPQRPRGRVEVYLYPI